MMESDLVTILLSEQRFSQSIQLHKYASIVVHQIGHILWRLLLRLELQVQVLTTVQRSLVKMLRHSQSVKNVQAKLMMELDLAIIPLNELIR